MATHPLAQKDMMHRNRTDFDSEIPPDPLDRLLGSAVWPDEASDELDNLLRMARWPEPVAEQPTEVQCSEVQCSEVQCSEKRSTGRRVVAAAIALSLGFIVWSVGIGRKPPSPGEVARGLATPSHDMSPPRNVDSPDQTPASDGSTAVSDASFPKASPFAIPGPAPRPAPGELRIRMLLRRNVLNGESGTAALNDDDELLRMLAIRVAQPHGDLASLIQPLMGRRTEIEQRLLKLYAGLSDAQAIAAIELLGHLGSEASVPMLQRERHKPSTHEPAVRALVELANPRLLCRLLRSETDPALRAEVAKAIRAKADRQTLLFTLATEGESFCHQSDLMRIRPAESF